MNKASQKVLDEFTLAAQYWGWQQECGTGSSVDAAMQQYFDAQKALVARIERLEQQSRELRLERKSLSHKGERQ